MQFKDTAYEFHLSSLEIQRAIVEGNRELIRLYEEKVKKVIERMWEG